MQLSLKSMFIEPALFGLLNFNQSQSRTCFRDFLETINTGPIYGIQFLNRHSLHAPGTSRSPFILVFVCHY